MLSTKIRTTIIALVASVSVASAAMAPSVSQAQPNWPALGHAIHCESLFAGEHAYEEKAKTAEAEGKTSLAQYYRTEALNYRQQAWLDNCFLGLAPTTATPPIATKPPLSAKLH